MMVFLTSCKTPWQEHIPFPCIIALSVKTNLESLKTARIDPSPLHSQPPVKGCPTASFSQTLTFLTRWSHCSFKGKSEKCPFHKGQHGG